MSVEDGFEEVEQYFRPMAKGFKKVIIGSDNDSEDCDCENDDSCCDFAPDDFESEEVSFDEEDY